MDMKNETTTSIEDNIIISLKNKNIDFSQVFEGVDEFFFYIYYYFIFQTSETYCTGAYKNSK
jgi:hypothetical protein